MVLEGSCQTVSHVFEGESDSGVLFVIVLLFFKYTWWRKKVTDYSLQTRCFTAATSVTDRHLPRTLVVFKTQFHTIIFPLLTKLSLPGIISQASPHNSCSPFPNPFLENFSWTWPPSRYLGRWGACFSGFHDPFRCTCQTTEVCGALSQQVCYSSLFMFEAW